jgi:hypothetical protein
MNESHIGAIFQESPVPDSEGIKETDHVCKKMSATQYVIDGKEIPMPVKVGAASMLMQAFLVDANTVENIIKGTGYRALVIWPGKAIVQLLAVDYRENDLGDYNEGAIIFPVVTPGQKLFPLLGAWLALISGKACNYVYRMPVNQPFTTHAGRFIWGFPKWPTQMDFEFNDKTAMGYFSDNGQLVYKIQAATGGKMAMKDQKSPSVTVRNGKAYKTYGISSGSGVTFKVGGAEPEIGNAHPLALELRSLGLPKKPMFSVSAREIQMNFNGPETVNIGEKFLT